MADSSVSINDSTSTARPLDAQLVGSDYQQVITIGDGTNAGRINKLDAAGRLCVITETTRYNVHLQVDGIAAVAAEALVSYGGYRAGTALTAGTGAYVVTAGRTFRIQSIALWGSGTALDRVRCRVRALATAAAAGSPIYAGTAIAFGANSGATSEVSYPDGNEIPAGFGIGITVIGATTSTWGIDVHGYEYTV